jgi:DNA adenine methylase
MLKWMGSKRWLVPRLREVYEPHRRRRLVEPFVGGMAVALGLQPARALLADVNPHLANFYRWVQRGMSTHLAMLNDAESYYQCRAMFNDAIRRGTIDSSIMAELFYYLNRTGFNGVCRFNRDGEFNVPVGKYSTITYVRDFSQWAVAMHGWKIECCDFGDLSIESDDFIFADPPYNATFVDYSSGGFSWNDQVRLADLLAKHDGPVVATNLATPHVLEIYRERGFVVETVSAPRSVSRDGDRAPVQEMLAMKNCEGKEQSTI